MEDLDAQADNSIVSTTVSRAHTMVLPERPTTGFRWSVEVTDDTIIGVVTKEFRPRASKPGAGGERVFVVTALAPGSATATWTLRRAWEGGAIEQRVAVTFQVS